MPRYEYECARCGPFSETRPLAEYELPTPCPGCGLESPRSVLCFPAISTRSPRRRGEAAAPATGFGHGAGCGCCGGKSFTVPRKKWTAELL